MEIIKWKLKNPCYVCNGTGFHPGKRVNKSVVCKTCHGTGKYSQNHYIHIVNGVAIDGDTIK